MHRSDAAASYSTPGLVVTTSALYAVAYAVLLRDAVSAPLEPLLFTLVAIGMAGLRFGAEDAMRRSRAGHASRARLLLVVSGVAYLAMLLAQGLPGAWTVRSYLSAGYQLFIMLAAYGLASTLATVFGDHAGLMKTLYRHRAVSERNDAVRDLRFVIADAMDSLTHAQHLLTTGFALMVLIVVVGWINGQFPSTTGLGLLAASGISRYLVQTTIGTIADEYRYLGDGSRLPRRYRRRRLVQATGLLFVAAVVAFAIARNRSLVPYTYLQAFFAWLSDLFPQVDVQTPPPQMNEPYEVFQRIREGLALGEETADPPAFLQSLLVILQGMLRAGIVGSLILFIAAPLFSRNFRRDVREMGVRRAILEWLRSVRRAAILFFREMAQRIRRVSVPGRLQNGEKRERASQGVDATQSPRKTRELAMFSRRFTRLLRWAEKRGAGRRRGEAPSEFTERLAQRYPHLAPALLSIGNLYEKNLYSGNLLSRDDAQHLNASFHTVLRTNP